MPIGPMARHDLLDIPDLPVAFVAAAMNAFVEHRHGQSR